MSSSDKKYVSFNLLHYSDSHAKPVVFNPIRHKSFAVNEGRPLFFDKTTSTFRIAVDYNIMLPKVYVYSSVPFYNGNEINEGYLH